MGDFLNDLREFLFDVFGHWQSWASGGGLGGAIVILIALYERISGKNMAKRLYLSIIIAAFFFAAFFMAWRDKTHQLSSLQDTLKSPHFRIDNFSAWWGSDHHSRLIVIVSCLLENPSGPASAAVDWQVELKFTSRKAEGTILPPLRNDLPVAIQGRNEHLILRAVDHLIGRTTRPIPAGGSIPGWIVAYFRDLSPTDVDTYKPTLVLSCVDVVSHTRQPFEFKTNRPKAFTLPWDTDTRPP